MFGWFSPICPCDPAAKLWIESRLEWLTRQFGLHVLLESPVISQLQIFSRMNGMVQKRPCCASFTEFANT